MTNITKQHRERFAEKMATNIYKDRCAKALEHTDNVHNAIYDAIMVQCGKTMATIPDDYAAFASKFHGVDSVLPCRSYERDNRLPVLYNLYNGRNGFYTSTNVYVSRPVPAILKEVYIILGDRSGLHIGRDVKGFLNVSVQKKIISITKKAIEGVNQYISHYNEAVDFYKETLNALTPIRTLAQLKKRWPEVYEDFMVFNELGDSTGKGLVVYGDTAPLTKQINAWKAAQAKKAA